MHRRNILVVGAGPVGTVAALACARFGHRVTLLEAQQKIDDSPRASTTQPPTLEIIAELGLIDEYIAQAIVSPPSPNWNVRAPPPTAAPRSIRPRSPVTSGVSACGGEAAGLSSGFSRLPACPTP